MRIEKELISKTDSLCLAFVFTVILTFPFAVSAGERAGTAQTESQQSQAPAQTYEYSWLEKVEPEYVCMVNDKRFPNVQIPVEVNGKTYYGCCQMCKAKLENVQEMREGRDPVSGVIVDKASAVIGAGPDWVVYYFENEENLKRFDQQMADQQ